MSGVPDDGNNNLVLPWHAIFLELLCGVHSNLVARAKRLVVTGLADVLVLQAGPHGVNIEEGILPVLDIGDRVAVNRLMAGVAHGC